MPSPSLWRASSPELIGTFALVFVGSVSVTIFPIVTPFGGASLLGIVLAHGLTLMFMIYSIGHMSGCHINPVVTLSLVATGRLGAVSGLSYVIFQLIGAALAGFVHAGLLPQGRAGSFWLTLPSSILGISEGTAFQIEAILTFFLVFTIFGSALSGRAPADWHGMAIGMTLAAALLVGGPLTGASLNPARTFGPAVASGNFTAHWVYWAGPILGALVAAFIARYVLMQSGEKAGTGVNP